MVQRDLLDSCSNEWRAILTCTSENKYSSENTVPHFFFFSSVCYFQEYGSVVSFKFRKLFTSEKNLLFKTVVIALQVHLILSHFICIATLIRGTVNALLKIKTWDRSFEGSFLYGLHIG